MNWLSHIFLSNNHIEYQHGNLLADLLKGKSWKGASDQFNAGLLMHRSIDCFTDHHPEVIRSKSRLGENRYLKGVVVDITYDHLLFRNWHRYSKISPEEFVNSFHKRSKAILRDYPANPRNFLSRLIESGHLMDYISITGIEKALRRIDSRLSQRMARRESAISYLPAIRNEIATIECDFLSFMPDLIGHFKSASGLSFEDHWLR